MPDAKNDDPLFASIRQGADVIRYLCSNIDTYPADAWSKDQLVAMLDEIQREADKIIRLTGVPDLDAHYENVWGELGESRNVVGGNGADKRYQPYSETGPD